MLKAFLILTIPICAIVGALSPAAEVAFLELHSADGRPVQLEPGGRFGHVAIRYRGQWLHAHPHCGVELTDSLEEYGDQVVVIKNEARPEPTDEQVLIWLGKPFDRTYRWDNPIATYCTRLVAELLGVKPTPMLFSSELWQNHFMRTVGTPGLSPDELYRALLEQDFHVQPNCETELAR